MGMIFSDTIDAGTIITDVNAKAVTATLDRFNVDMVDLIDHISSTLTPESITLGSRWYTEAFDFAYDLACRFNITENEAAAVLSALSPRMGWVRNKNIAEHVIRETVEYGKDASEIKGALSANIRMAHAILHGSSIDTTLTGMKRRSFYNNIITAGESDDVTIDTWMQRAVMAVSPDQGMDLDESLNFLKARGHSGYIAIAYAVRYVAKDRGLYPAEIQAGYWIVASGSVHGWHHKGHGKDALVYG